MATLLSKEILQQYVVTYSAFPPQFICMYFKFVFVYVDYLRNVFEFNRFNPYFINLIFLI